MCVRGESFKDLPGFTGPFRHDLSGPLSPVWASALAVRVHNAESESLYDCCQMYKTDLFGLVDIMRLIMHRR